MPYSVTVENPSLADGAEVHVDGLGPVTKGKKNIFSDEQAEAFEVLNIRNETVYAPKYGEDGFPLDADGNQVTDPESSVDIPVYEVGKAQKRTPFVELFDELSGVSAAVVSDDVDEDGEESVDPEHTDQIGEGSAPHIPDPVEDGPKPLFMKASDLFDNEEVGPHFADENKDEDTETEMPQLGEQDDVPANRPSPGQQNQLDLGGDQ